MNYIKEINMFYDWLETNPISDSSIVLWHALMNISNKCGWKTEFAVAQSTLSVKTGLKKDAIIRARLRLQQAGRIDFVSRSGQLSALYTIKCFDNCVVLNDTNRDTNRALTATQTASIPKLNKTKEEVYKKKAHDGELSNLEISNTKEFVDRIKQIKLTTEQILNYWAAFNLNESEPAYFSREKKLQHFRNWLKNLKNGSTTVTGSNTKNPNYGSAAGAISLLNKVKQQFNG